MILCFCFFCVETRISQHMVRFCTGILEKILLFVQNAYDKNSQNVVEEKKWILAERLFAACLQGIWRYRKRLTKKGQR